MGVVLLWMAAALRFWNLAGPSLWYDEAYTWWVATQVSPAASLASSLQEFIPPLSYFLWRGWAALTGTTEFALRSMSALLGVVGVAAAGRIGYCLSRRECTALATAALFTIAPPLLWASREVRMYGPLLTFTLLADVALLEVLFGPVQRRRAWAWGWGAMTLCALYTVVLACFWLIGQGFFVLVLMLVEGDSARRRGWFRALVAPAVAAAILYLVWLAPALAALGDNAGYWPGVLTAQAFFATAVQSFVVFDFLAPPALALRVSMGVATFALLAPVLAARCLPPRRLPSSLYPLCYALPPLIVMSLVYRTVPKWGLRHAVIFAPALYLVLASVAGGLLDCRGRRAPSGPVCAGLWAAVGLVCAPLILANYNLLFNPAFGHDDWRGVASYVAAHRQPEEIVAIETGSVAPAWYYYAGREDVLPLPDDPLMDVHHVLHYENTAPTLNAHLTGASGVWLVAWLGDVTDPTDLVATLLAEIGEPSVVPGFHGVGLRHFRLTQDPLFPALPVTTARAGVELLPGLSLWGFDLPKVACPADEPVAVRTWWTTPDPAAHAGKVFQASFRIYDADGNVWAHHDGTPGGGDYRPERWPEATLVMGHVDVPLLPGIPPGTYTATLTLYELSGVQAPPYTLGAFEVGRPSQPPPLPEDVVSVDGPGVDQPLHLLGVRLDRTTVQPCEALHGWLFWEVRMAPAAGYRVRVGVGEQQVVLRAPAGAAPYQWQPGDRFATQFSLPIDCRALAVRAPLRVALVDAAATRGGLPLDVMDAWRGPDVEVNAERAFDVPAHVTPVQADFGEGVARLVGYYLTPESGSEETLFTLVLYWQAGAPVDVPYAVFVHVTPPDALAPLAAQHDGWPGMGDKPTYTWAEGEIIADPHPLPALPPGLYQIRVGLYGPDGTRLPVIQDGVALPDDALPLVALRVR